MTLDATHVEYWLLGQLVLGVAFIIKEIWRIGRDQSHKNAEDINLLKVGWAENRKDIDSLWERLRMMERREAPGSDWQSPGN